MQIGSRRRVAMIMETQKGKINRIIPISQLGVNAQVVYLIGNILVLSLLYMQSIMKNRYL